MKICEKPIIIKEGDQLYDLKSVIEEMFQNFQEDKIDVKGKKAILQMLRRNCIRLHIYHNLRYHYYRNVLFYVFRIPCLVLSGTNGFFAIGLKDYMYQETLSLLNAGISFVTGILCSIEILFNFQKRMEGELETYKKFYNLSVRINKDIITFNNKTDIDQLVTDNLTLYFDANNGNNIVNGKNKNFMDEFERIILSDDKNSSKEITKLKDDLNAVYKICSPSKCCCHPSNSLYKNNNNCSSCCKLDNVFDPEKFYQFLKEHAEYEIPVEELELIDKKVKDKRADHLKSLRDEIKKLKKKNPKKECSYDCCIDIDDKWISFDNDEDLDDKCTFCDNFSICCSCCDTVNACSTDDIQTCIPEEKHARAESNNVDLTRSTMYGY